jgi:hypothetical protein
MPLDEQAKMTCMKVATHETVAGTEGKHYNLLVYDVRGKRRGQGC